MEIAKYFATLGFKVTKGEIKKVDDFLGTIEKGLKTAGKESEVVQKTEKKRRKSTDETTKAIKQQLTWQEKLNKFKQGELKLTFAIAQNQKQLARNFKQSIDAMVIKPTTAKKLKEQQALYNGLFGATVPKKMVGATGANQSAWNRQFNQRIQQLTQQSKASRASRQADLDAVFGIPKAQSNPRVASLINDRLSYLGGRKSDALADMAAYYRNEEKVAKLKTDTQKQIEESEKRVLAARKRDIERRIYNQKRMADWERKQQIIQNNLAERERQRQADRLELARLRGSSGGRAVSGRSHYMHAGGAAGAFARYGIQSLPFIGGVYGLGQINSISQELQANQLALEAVAGPQAGMYQQYLNNLGTRLGMTTRQLQPSFTQYLANAQGTALEPSLMRDFESFTQYGAVMGLSPEEMKGSLKAITQMVSKQQIYAEELRGQLAERMPAAVRLMAEAVTGGDTEALIEMMAKGQLDPNKVLPKFFERMRGISEPMLPKYFQTSRFAQGTMNKAVEEQIMNFAKSGGDEAFTRFFRVMSELIRGADPLVKGLAESFNDLTVALEAPRDIFLDINQALTDFSTISGVSKGNILEVAMLGGLMATKWGRVAAMFAAIALVMQDISYGMKGKTSLTKDFMEFAGITPNVSGEGSMKTPTGHIGTGLMVGAPFAAGGPIPFAAAAAAGTAGSLLFPSSANKGPFVTPMEQIVAEQRRSMNYRAHLMSSGLFNPDGTPKEGYSFEKLKEWETANPFNTSKFGNGEINIKVDANITAQDATDFSRQLNMKIKEALLMLPQKE